MLHHHKILIFHLGLSTDIEKAFLHVSFDGNDRDFTRFFWLSDPKNPESEFQVFRYKTVLFGSTSSPFMLNATLHHHLENFSTPVAKDIRDNMYVTMLSPDVTKKPTSSVTIK